MSPSKIQLNLQVSKEQKVSHSISSRNNQ